MGRLSVVAAVAALCAGGLFAQTALRNEVFQGRQAYVLDNGVMRVSLLRGGGHIAEARFVSDDPRRNVNPMRVPHYQTIEPYQYNPAKHDALYGSDSHRWLSSGYMGHLLCFPAFGAPSSPAEVKAGLGNHGEAPIVEWKPLGEGQQNASSFRYGAQLPKTQFQVERSVTLPAGESVLYIEESVDNLALYDRPINWVQHATFGPPFVMPGENFLDMSGTKGQAGGGGTPDTNSVKPDSAVEWPQGVAPDGSTISLRTFQPKPHAGTYFAVLMDQARPLSFFTMYNPRFSTLIGYLFRTAESPWIGDFQENQRHQFTPWDGKVITRGIEFGTTPFPEGIRKSVQRGSFLGVPTFRWIGGREKLMAKYVLFLATIPSDFRGVRDVIARDGAITVFEQGSERQIRLPASRLGLLQ